VACACCLSCLLQTQLSVVLDNFISCATGITRLSRPELVTGLLGAKQSDMQDLTPLVDLVVPPECRELVRLPQLWLPGEPSLCLTAEYLAGPWPAACVEMLQLSIACSRALW